MGKNVPLIQRVYILLFVGHGHEPTQDGRRKNTMGRQPPGSVDVRLVVLFVPGVRKVVGREILPKKDKFRPPEVEEVHPQRSDPRSGGRAPLESRVPRGLCHWLQSCAKTDDLISQGRVWNGLETKLTLQRTGPSLVPTERERPAETRYAILTMATSCLRQYRGSKVGR